VVWCGVVWCGVVWCGVVWCGVVWCGVVWCGVVWCLSREVAMDPLIGHDYTEMRLVAMCRLAEPHGEEGEVEAIVQVLSVFCL
jgi:hypothetical protein